MQDSLAVMEIPKPMRPRKIRVTYPYRTPVEGIPLAWTTAAFEITPVISGHFQRMIVQEPVVIIDTGNGVQVVRLSDEAGLADSIEKIKIEWIDEPSDQVE